MEQTDLFKTGRARKTDPSTSHRAAAFVNPRVSRLQEIVLNYIRNHRGCTDREMVNDLRKEHGGSESTWRTRRSELEDIGLVRHLGDVKVDGKRHRTWTAAEHAVR